MQKYVFVLLAVLSFSCKDDVKKNAETEVKEKVVPPENPTLQVIMNAVVTQDDVFEVYFYEEGQERFDPKDYVSVKVKGSDTAQNIVLKLPDHVEPIRLRVDIGRSAKQKDIILNDVTLSYKDNTKVLTDEEFSKWFRANKYIEFNEEDGLIITKVLDGKYDPYFLSHNVGSLVKSVMRQPEASAQ